jgi:outer membrane murein-binding lipoprotein Lpp
VGEAPPPPAAERGPPSRRDDRPARAGELRGLRRWLLVAAVWATAATAIAVIALLAADKARDDNTEAGRRSARTAGQISTAQRRLDARLDELERRLGQLPSAQELSDLSDSLKRAEAANGRTADKVDELTGSVDDLEARVESLEEAPADTAAQTETAP